MVQYWLRFRGEAALFAVTFAAAALIGAGVLQWRALSASLAGVEPVLLLAVIAAAIAVPAYLWRAGWHLLSNAFATHQPRPLAQPWVIDGDTIDDLAAGVRYRLANIDAPKPATTPNAIKRPNVASWRSGPPSDLSVKLPSSPHGRHGAKIATAGASPLFSSTVKTWVRC